MTHLVDRSKDRSIGLTPLRIAAIYAALGALWIVASDYLLGLVAHRVGTYAVVQTLKGWAFVGGTALILYLLLRWHESRLRELDRSRREAERRLATLISNLPGMVYRCRNEPTWTMEFASGAACLALTGFEPEERVGDGGVAFNDLIHPDDRERVWLEVQAAVADGRPFELVYRIQRKDGQVRWVWEQGRAIDSAGEVLEGFITDISTRKEAEAQLVKQTEFLGMLQVATAAANEAEGLEEALEAVVREVCRRIDWPVGHVYVPDGSAARVLRSAGVWWTSDPDRFAKLRAVSEEMTFEPGVGLPGRVMETGNPEWIEELRDDPDSVCVRSSSDLGASSAFAFPVYVGREPVAVLEFFHSEPRPRDPGLLQILLQIGTQLGRVVERQRAEEERRAIEEQVRQAQKMEAIGRLAGGVAHDFNNFLTAVMAEAELALLEMEPEDPEREPFEHIRELSQRAGSLTRQLLSFSRKQIVAPAVLSLNEVVSGLEKMLRRLLGEDVDLVTRLASDLRPVRADRGQLEQVLTNLIVNARDAMPGGGRIVVMTENGRVDEDLARAHPEARPGDFTLMTVSDSGTGMPAEVRARAFEPFFTTKRAGEGTGLGLATSYGIIKQAGGHISLYSEEGVGTTVRIYLPSVVAEAADQVAREPAPPPTGRETVLVVEDEESVRKVTVKALTSLGYAVRAARSGEEALARLERSDPAPDLLITDVVLPGIGGRLVADRALELSPATRVLFVSGYSDDVILKRRLMHADASLLQKPYTMDSLARKVREVLDQDPTANPTSPEP